MKNLKKRYLACVRAQGQHGTNCLIYYKSTITRIDFSPFGILKQRIIKLYCSVSMTVPRSGSIQYAPSAIFAKGFRYFVICQGTSKAVYMHKTLCFYEESACLLLKMSGDFALYYHYIILTEHLDVLRWVILFYFQVSDYFSKLSSSFNDFSGK